MLSYLISRFLDYRSIGCSIAESAYQTIAKSKIPTGLRQYYADLLIFTIYSNRLEV